MTAAAATTTGGAASALSAAQGQTLATGDAVRQYVSSEKALFVFIYVNTNKTGE